MRKYCFLWLCSVVLASFAMPGPGFASDREFVIKDGRLYYRKGEDTVSGVIYNVKRRDIRIEANGRKVAIDLEMIDFNDRLNEVFTEGMAVTAEGVYKDSDEFTAYTISFVKGNKRYTYRSKIKIPYQQLYKKIK
jgi:hypothetical protein